MNYKISLLLAFAVIFNFEEAAAVSVIYNGMGYCANADTYQASNESSTVESCAARCKDEFNSQAFAVELRSLGHDRDYCECVPEGESCVVWSSAIARNYIIEQTSGNCNPNFIDSAGDSCQDFTTKGYCTATGSYGAGWYHLWGSFEDFAVNEETALVCPQCGCKVGNCNPNFIDSAGDSCQNLAIYGFCTATGGYGAEWTPDWGFFEDFAVNEETALVCPQCGCKVATEADSGTLRYVDDGCHKERNTPDDVVGFYQPESSEAFVRCCSEDGASCNTPSNCKDPTNLVNYSRAESICSSNGKRLCTKDELLTDICCGTGGKCDSYGVWTSTRNTGDGDDETATTEAQAETTTESGGYTLMENEYCTGGQYDGTGFDGTIFNTVRYASLNEAVSVCNEIEECGCVWHDGCGDVFNVAEGSGTSSSTSYSTCDIPTNSYIKP